ncbi:hypothetical protein H0N96_03430, partial [Candidatus Micrarchaeota archaeon]|nr:hypothetical protein [Candidatus Micrarchaeota archaeon]
GFSPNPSAVSQTLRANEQAFLNAWLIYDNDVNGSIAIPSDPFVVDAETGFNVAALKPGRNYAARFQLVTRQDSELEQTGFHFSLEPLGIATITSFKPFAPQALGGTLDETLGCGDVAAVNASSGLNLAWLDLAFQGAKNVPVEVNFSVSLTPALDQTTHQGILSVKARSFAVNNSQYLRNPFDVNYSINPGEVLESGCNAKSDYYNYPVTSLGYSCSEQACVFVKFIQAGREGFDGFETTDLKDAALLYLSEVNPEVNQTVASLLASSNLTPLIVYYSVESFKELKAYSGVAFEFNETDLKVYNASTPLPPEGFDCRRDAFYVIPDNKTKSNATGVPFDSFKNPLVLDYSRLIECYDYPPINGPSKQNPYSFGGVLYALPWRATPHSDFKTFFATADSPDAIAPEDTTAHESWLKILPSFPIAPGISELTLTLSQTQGGTLNDEGADSSAEFAAEPLNVSEPFIPEESNTSLITAKFKAVMLRNAFDNVFSLEVPDCQPYCRAALKIVGVEYAGMNYSRVDGTEFDTEDGKKIILSDDYTRAEIRAGDLNQGEEFDASFLLAPLSIEVTGLQALSQVVLKHDALDSASQPLPATQREPKSVSIRGANVSTISYFGPGIDNCGGAVHVNYNTAVQLLSFQQGCTDLGFRVTPILPADAIFASVNSTVTLLVRPTAGDLNAINCFESCSIDATGNVGGCTPGFTALTTTGSYALRYNTEAASCPVDFKLAGADKLKGVELTVAISAPGVSDQFAKQLKIHVVAENKFKSLYVAPIYASYALKGEGARDSFYPQVWGVFNHKQIGKRTITVASEDGELEFAFEGPGAQFFAFSPSSGSGGVKVYEKLASGGKKLVLDSSGNQSDSEYFEAMREDFDKRFGDSEVDCNQADPECADYKKQFAEFNSKSKQVSDEFLNSLSGNEPFNKNFFVKLQEKTKKIANTTAFWRSFQQQLYCRDADDNGVSCAGRSTDAACCRGSIYDWVNVTTQNNFGLQQCVFCNNTWRGNPALSCGEDSSDYLPCTYAQAAVYNCDQRCTPEGFASVDDGDWISTGGSVKYCEASKYKGIASISDADVSACKTSVCPVELDDSGKPFCYTDSNGDGFVDLNGAEGDSIEPATLLTGIYSCASGKKIAVSKQCTASCDNWCGRAECSATCDSNGLNPVSTGSQEVLGEMPAGVKLVTVTLDSSDPAYQTYKLLPRRMFPEFGDPQKFAYHFSINTEGFKNGKAVSLKQELGLSEVNGCSEAQKYAEEGSYLVTQENVPDVGSGMEEWLSKADVITIARDKYLGVQCLKQDAKWDSLALCAPLYADSSTLYGSCVNSLALNPDLLSLTFFGRLSMKAGLFVYPVDSSGVVQGEPDDDATKRKMRGFFLSERGYAVAFRDSGKTGGWFSGYTVTQDFDYWNPLGQKASATQMVWKTPWYKTGFFKIAIIAAVAAAIIATTGILAQPMVNVLAKIVPATIMKTGAFLATHLVTGIITAGALGTMAFVSFWPDSDAIGAAGPCMPGTAKYALIDSFGNDDFENSDLGVRGCKGTSWQACAKDSCSQDTKS